MRKKIVAGNWKMNTNLQDGIYLASSINNKLLAETGIDEIGVVIAPPFTHLIAISKVINNDRICLTAQNCATESKGAYTGEVSAEMLKSVGVKAVIIGHSERREYYKECSEVLNKKVKQVLANDMKTIFCCGEKLDQRKAENHFEVIKNQLEEVVFKLSENEFDKIIIAYEPIWAIGTGVTASSDQAQEMHAYIRKLIAENFNNTIAENTTILYGGSCKPSNSVELFAKADVDGGLIGGASLKANDFLEIIKSY